MPWPDAILLVDGVYSWPPRCTDVAPPLFGSRIGVFGGKLLPLLPVVVLSFTFPLLTVALEFGPTTMPQHRPWMYLVV